MADRTLLEHDPIAAQNQTANSSTVARPFKFVGIVIRR